MSGKENKIAKYLKEYELEWGDLKPSEKKATAYSIGYINQTFEALDAELSKITSEIEALKERMPSAVHQIDSVKDFIQNHKLAIVDFFSERCVPCFDLDQPLERTAKRDEEVAIGRIDIGDHKDVVMKYNAWEIPLLISFRDGKVVQRSHGAPKDREHRFELVRWIAQRLKVPQEEYEKTFEMVKKVAKSKGWKLNPNKSRVQGLVSALTYNRLEYGYNLCPCKSPLDENGEVIEENICPCSGYKDFPGSSDRIKSRGICYCGLYCHPDYIKKHKKAKKRESMKIKEKKEVREGDGE